jgi:hypothetical protein
MISFYTLQDWSGCELNWDQETKNCVIEKTASEFVETPPRVGYTSSPMYSFTSASGMLGFCVFSNYVFFLLQLLFVWFGGYSRSIDAKDEEKRQITLMTTRRRKTRAVTPTTKH